ncbi:hypothetical protein CIL05_20990 [Virgibacillus profundi]|uniref:Uncharacterized protein n=1 Tax=Virgibacillus profundi TaxID=2024555 RepID=A0A2A2I6K9_9BACI|nr:hypothetical protein CIL05_20990 [Virgibacillus profundi]PXY51819.1 hypothetical protein CIT14_21095 [Virgibacillus profundi]
MKKLKRLSNNCVKRKPDHNADQVFPMAFSIWSQITFHISSFLDINSQVHHKHPVAIQIHSLLIVSKLFASIYYRWYTHLKNQCLMKEEK